MENTFPDWQCDVRSYKPEHMPVYDQRLIDAFWISMNEMTEQYLKP